MNVMSFSEKPMFLFINGIIVRNDAKFEPFQTFLLYHIFSQLLISYSESSAIIKTIVRRGVIKSASKSNCAGVFPPRAQK